MIQLKIESKINNLILLSKIAMGSDKYNLIIKFIDDKRIYYLDNNSGLKINYMGKIGQGDINFYISKEITIAVNYFIYNFIIFQSLFNSFINLNFKISLDAFKFDVLIANLFYFNLYISNLVTSIIAKCGIALQGGFNEC